MEYLVKKLNLDDVRRYVEENIGDFHSRRIARLDELKLHEVLQRKNPYLFKAKYFLEADVIIESLLNAHIFRQAKKRFLVNGWKVWRYLSIKKFMEVGNPQPKGLIWNSITMAFAIL